MEDDGSPQQKDSLMFQKFQKCLDLAQLLLLEAKSGNVSNVVDLIYKGAGFTTDWLGTTPLHWAAYNNSCELAELFLSKLGSSQTAAKEPKNKVDRTPLHIAALEGYSDLVKIFLKHGANPNCQDMLGMTPLHSAAYSGSVECVRDLLHHGADSSIQNKFGKTALEMARGKQFFGVISILESPPKVARLSMDPDKPLVKSRKNKMNVVKSKNKINAKDGKKITSPLNDTQGNQIYETYTFINPALHDNGPSNYTDNSLSLKAREIEKETLELLKEHGIQMLEPDQNGSVVTSAIESGRKVVLTKAGKLALKTLSDPPKNNSPGTEENLNPIRKLNFTKKMLLNGEVLKIDPMKVKSFRINNNKIILEPSKVFAARVFEGKVYKEEEDDVLIEKLKFKISDLRHQATVLEALAKKKHSEADAWDQQLRSLLRLKGENIST